MIRDKVIDSLGRIDDELIQGVEVLRAKPRRIKRFRWVAVAACLCIIFALTFSIFTPTFHIPDNDFLLVIPGSLWKMKNADPSATYYPVVFDDDK